MTLRISGKNMDVGDALRGKADARFEAVIRKYFDGNYSGHLTLEPEGPGYSAQAMVHLDTGAILRSGAHGDDPIAAYEQMADAIEKRLRRYSRRLKQHRRGPADFDEANGSAQSYVLAAPDDDDALEEDYSPPVIAESTSALRRMSVGEAVLELDFGGAEVVVFRHAGHGGLNVVYRRADGNIGWIDPALRAN
jgi:ribosomal subunit interface protein